MRVLGAYAPGPTHAQEQPKTMNLRKLIFANPSATQMALGWALILIPFSGNAQETSEKPAAHHAHTQTSRLETPATEQITARLLTADGAWGFLGTARATAIHYGSGRFTVPVPPLTIVSSLFLGIFLAALSIVHRRKKHQLARGL